MGLLLHPSEKLWKQQSGTPGFPGTLGHSWRPLSQTARLGLARAQQSTVCTPPPLTRYPRSTTRAEATRALQADMGTLQASPGLGFPGSRFHASLMVKGLQFLVLSWGRWVSLDNEGWP